MIASWLPRARDVVAVAIGLLTAGDALVTQLSGHHVAFAWFSFSAALIGSAALWKRREHPVAVTVLGLLICAVARVDWTLAVGLTTLAVRRRDRVTWTLSGLAVVAAVVEYAGAHHGLQPSADLVYAVPWVAFFTLGGAYIGMRRDSLAGLHERAERAEAEQEMRAEQARLNERTRIAREMHDVLAHRISLIALHAGGLEVTENPAPETVELTAGLIRETARQALEDLRSVLGVLHSTSDPATELAPQPKFADVADLIRASAEAGIPVTLTLAGPLHLGAEVPEPVGRAAYRVVQESLTNIHKHARGALTEVRLDGAPGSRLNITVENSHPPAYSSPQSSSPLPGSGSGLVGLRERVAFVGGTLTSGPTPFGGFQVQAGLPWPSAASAVSEPAELAKSAKPSETAATTTTETAALLEDNDPAPLEHTARSERPTHATAKVTA
jgi:signal transduction histidine kinase